MKCCYNSSAIITIDLLANEKFVMWLLYPSVDGNKYWDMFQEQFPQSVPVIARVKAEAAHFVLSEDNNAHMLLPCG